MDGQGIFQFTSEIAEFFLEQVLETNYLESEDIDFYVFHQANSFILEHLRIKLGISRDKFVVEMSETGNLVSKVFNYEEIACGFSRTVTTVKHEISSILKILGV